MRIVITCRKCKKEFIENTDRLFSEYTADSDKNTSKKTRCPSCGEEIIVKVNFWTEQQHG